MKIVEFTLDDMYLINKVHDIQGDGVSVENDVNEEERENISTLILRLMKRKNRVLKQKNVNGDIISVYVVSGYMLIVKGTSVDDYVYRIISEFEPHSITDDDVISQLFRFCYEHVIPTEGFDKYKMGYELHKRVVHGERFIDTIIGGGVLATIATLLTIVIHDHVFEQ